jgi:succinate dehydrogenase/fumarate reductase flavoprotein subunit
LADAIELETDVLVIGGGMAACWAAVSAAKAGAAVVLVDKGFVGTSGVTATGGPNHWWVPPDPIVRREAIERRMATAYGLADPEWMARIIDTTWRLLPQLADHYPFGSDGKGGIFYSGVRGPEYLRALRAYAIASGVRILDHHPALELYVHADGSVAGAAGHARLQQRPWRARAGTVILATGGCAFRSGLIGSHTNTGDGYLMAAEAGAELSGMEFATAYSLSPTWNSTRTLPYFAARFFDAAGNELDIPPPMSGHVHLRALGAAMLAGPVYADLCDAPAPLRTILRDIQPASLTPFERKGIDLFEQRFEMTLFAEGTIRGVGGLRIIDDDCQTTVPGLFAAGDAATRELIAGATSGGGAQNSAWALTSGHIAGQAAARIARAQGRRSQEVARAVGQAGLQPGASIRDIDRKAILSDVQAQTIAYDKALWRNAPSLEHSREIVEVAWREVAGHLHAGGIGQVAARELAAMTATARWSVAATLARGESRGMHVRTDHPDTNPERASRLLVGGLDEVWSRPELSNQPARIAA